MSVEKREFPCWFASHEHEVETDHPQQFSLCLHRAFYAFSLLCDIPDEERRAYLDFGSGGGFITELLAPGFKLAVGVEKRPEARSYAKKIHGRPPKLMYLSTLDEAAHFGPYDFITALEVIEHVDQETAGRLVKSLASLLTQKGTLYISTPVAVKADGSNPHNKFHLHEYQPGELKRLLEESFKEVELSSLASRTMNAVCRGPKA